MLVMILFVNDIDPNVHDDNDGDEVDDVTSIIQLRLPHCLPPTSSKRGRGHYGWGNNLKSLSISFFSPISSSSLFSV